MNNNDKIIRVFPRKTNGTPYDENVYFTGPPITPLEERNVHVSCTFTWDKQRAESLAKEWETQNYNVKIGGPAYDDQGGEFIPGRYLKYGYTITSRGCNNRCWFCYTWKREGDIRELTIKEGWRVIDSNLLQCSESHIRKVFSMLKKQPMPVSFLGGLEAKILQDWHIGLLAELNNISQCYFAYDTPDDYEPLRKAARMVFDAGIASPQSHRICCYVLIGYHGDTFENAEKRLHQVLGLGLLPFAMLYRDENGRHDHEWVSFQAYWANPWKIYGSRKNDKGQYLLSQMKDTAPYERNKTYII